MPPILIAASKFGLRLSGNSGGRRTGPCLTINGRLNMMPRVGSPQTATADAAASSFRLFETCIDRHLRFSTRTYASSSSNSSPKDFTKLNRLEDANPERIRGIRVNPDSLGHSILPGNLIYKKYRWSGNTRKVPVELVHGYFWMLLDLKNTHQKPTLSNEALIPSHEAQPFPMLRGVCTLADPSAKVDLPSFFLDRPSPSAPTLVAISFRESGFKQVPSWTEPLEEAFPADGPGAVQIYRLAITERWVLYPLRNLLTRVMKQNTADPAEQATTLVHFGTKDVDDFRDILRMHNIMTSYVFLLDGRGRVRFAGSGGATTEDVQRLVGFTQELLAESDGGIRQKQQPKTKHKRGRR